MDEERKIPDPPAPPPEVTPAGSLPGAPTGAAGGVAPEVIAGAASSYAMISGLILNMVFDRRGQHLMTDGEKASWRDAWIAEVQRRQFLAVGGDVPEVALIGAVVMMFMARKDEGPKEEAPPAEEPKAA